jgi:hypothetical protein
MADSIRSRRHPPRNHQKSGTGNDGTDVLALVQAALQGIREGAVVIMVHEGRLTYIERRAREFLDVPLPGE